MVGIVKVKLNGLGKYAGLRIPMTEVCYICGGTDTVKYCSWCEEYLCVNCKNNPPKRLVAFLKKKLGIE